MQLARAEMGAIGPGATQFTVMPSGPASRETSPAKRIALRASEEGAAVFAPGVISFMFSPPSIIAAARIVATAVVTLM